MNRVSQSLTGLLCASWIALLPLPAMTMSAVADDAPSTDLEERLQEIEDEREIRELMVKYGQYLDSLDFARYARLFARNGEWSGTLSGPTPFKGPAEIQAAMEKAFADRVYDPDHVTNVHLVTNILIEIDGDRATGYSRWTVMSRNDDDEPYARLTGHYDDVFIRENGRWKFLKRVAQREIPGD